MSALLENTVEDIEILEGAFIEKIEIVGDPKADHWGDFQKVRMRVRWRTGLKVNGARTGHFEIWQDPEGNGPGFIALVEP